MYKAKWDKESRGILLTDKIDKQEEIVPPRPVFFDQVVPFCFITRPSKWYPFILSFTNTAGLLVGV